MTRRVGRCAGRFVLSTLLVLAAVPAGAQDVFELEVFGYDALSPGQSAVEFHGNGISHNIGTAPAAADHSPVHLSVELMHGWTRRVETALFIQSAPFGATGSARFAGGHVRAKVQLGQLHAAPLRFALSAEYNFNRPVFDRELQSLELRPILDWVNGRLAIIVNPSLELVTRSADGGGLDPVIDVLGRASWSVTPRVGVSGEYFSAAATTRHLTQDPQAHHLVFGGLDIDLGEGWDFDLGLGHCVTTGEPWLVKSVVGYRF